MVTKKWVNIASGNGLLPDGTKPIPEPMLTCHQRFGIHLHSISQEMLINLIINVFRDYTFRIIFPRGQWVKSLLPFHQYVPFITFMQHPVSKCSLIRQVTACRPNMGPIAIKLGLKGILLISFWSNGTLGNKILLKLNKKIKLFFQAIAFVNVICKNDSHFVLASMS